MLLSRLCLCTCLSLFSLGHADEVSADEKTTEAVVKAVVKAETDPNLKIDNLIHSRKSEEADAVAEATIDVLESESPADEVVSEPIMEKAKKSAEKTFKELADTGVGAKASAAAAAEVAVAIVDGASDLTLLPHEAKENAKKAAVAAGKAVADHPNDQAKALEEGITTVNKEETSGKVDLAKTSKGVVAKAKAAVSDLPALAEDAVEGVRNESAPHVAFFLAFVIFSSAAWVAKTKYAEYSMHPYEKSLRLIREEFNGVNGSVPRDDDDIESQYMGFEQMR